MIVGSLVKIRKGDSSDFAGELGLVTHKDACQVFDTQVYVLWTRLMTVCQYPEWKLEVLDEAG